MRDGLKRVLDFSMSGWKRIKTCVKQQYQRQWNNSTSRRKVKRWMIKLKARQKDHSM
jgi:hypothetical protein